MEDRNRSAYCHCCEQILLEKQGGQMIRRNPWRIVQGERLCFKCADDAENTREKGHKGYNRSPRPATIREKGKEAGTMQKRLDDYPVAAYDQETIFTELGRRKVFDPKWAIEIVTCYALASKDINGWLDTLSSTAADPEEKAAALHRLTETSEEYAWLCEKREMVADAIATAAKKLPR